MSIPSPQSIKADKELLMKNILWDILYNKGNVIKQINNDIINTIIIHNNLPKEGIVISLEDFDILTKKSILQLLENHVQGNFKEHFSLLSPQLVNPILEITAYNIQSLFTKIWEYSVTTGEKYWRPITIGEKNI